MSLIICYVVDRISLRYLDPNTSLYILIVYVDFLFTCKLTPIDYGAFINNETCIFISTQCFMLNTIANSWEDERVIVV